MRGECGRTLRMIHPSIRRVTLRVSGALGLIQQGSVAHVRRHPPPRFIIAAFAPENSWLYLEYITIQHFAPDRFLKLYEIKNAHNTNKRRPQFVNCSKQSSPTLSAGADGRIAITVFPAIVQAHRSETSVNL